MAASEQKLEHPNAPRCLVVSLCQLGSNALWTENSVIAGRADWGWAGQPPHKSTVYHNQLAVLLSHINEPATI